MDYDQQPAEYSDRDQTTAAPVPDAGEDDWSPLAGGEPKRCLDLFCGLGGFSQAFAEAPDWQVTTVDIAARFEPDIQADVMELRPSDFDQQFDLVLASPPCTMFSTSGNHEAWDLRDQTPVGEVARDHVGLLYHTVGLIRGLSPDYWYLENPRHGRVLWFLEQPTGTVTYCQYGREYMKPTGLWGEHPPMEYRSCAHGDDCHDSNTEDDGTSAIASMRDMGHAERAKVPYQLSAAIREAVDAALAGDVTEQVGLERAVAATDGGADE
jgi:hypothetical protein